MLIGERQLLEQSRRHKHPAPEIAVQWRPPMLRSTEEANVAGSQTGVATLVDVYSNVRSPLAVVFSVYFC